MQLHRWKYTPGLLEILVAVVIWGATPFVIRYAAMSFPSVELTALRLLLAGLVMGMIIGPRRLMSSIRKGSWLLVLLAFAGSTLPQIFYISAVRTVPVPVLVFITNGYPALAIILAVVFLNEKPAPRHWVGISLALVGLFLLAGTAGSLGGGISPGIVFALLASLGWGSSAITGKKVTARLSASEISAGRHLVGGVLTLPLFLIEPPVVTTVSWQAWLAVFALVLMLVGSFYLYYRGLAVVSVATASMMESFTPVMTLLMSMVFFGETLSGWRLAGALLVLSGCLLVTVGEAAQPAATVEEVKN